MTIKIIAEKNHSANFDTLSSIPRILIIQLMIEKSPIKIANLIDSSKKYIASTPFLKNKPNHQ